jgi:O-antigen ligase
MASHSPVLVPARPSPAWFWLLIAVVACPVRLDFGIGPFTTVSVIDLALLICAAYLALQFLCLHAIQIGPWSVAASVALPALVAAVSVTWAINERLAVAGAIKYFYAALIYFVGLQVGGSVSQATFKRAMVMVFLAWLAGSAAMYLNVPGFSFFLPQVPELVDGGSLDLLASLYTRLGHPYIGLSNDYGPLLALIGFIFLGYARAEGQPGLALLGGLAFTASILTFSRGLLAGLALSLAVYALVSRIRLSQLLLSVSAVALTFLVIAWLASGTSVSVGEREIEFAEIMESRLSAANVEIRLEAYKEALTSITDRPFLGYGAGHYDSSHPDSSLSLHNAFLEQWMYFGVIFGTVTVACYIALPVWFFSLRWKLHEWSHFTDALACAWLCLLVTAQVETFFEATTPRAITYALLGLCVALSNRFLHGEGGHFHARTP